MSSILGILLAPIIVFLVIVAPIWIVMHYLFQARRERLRRAEGTSSEDQELAQRMLGLLEKMELRIATLERILDADDPRWRDRRAAADRV